MNPVTILAVILVLAGFIFLMLSLRPVRQAMDLVPAAFQLQWRILGLLILFFCLGYLFFDLILLTDITFPLELVTGLVFAGGAIFVFIVINICHNSLDWFRQTDRKLRILNDTLEKQVERRTRALERSSQFLKTVLDSLQDSIAIINVDDHTIDNVNASFLEEFGLSEKEVVGRPCYEVTHQRRTPCAPPDDECPMSHTLESGEPAMCEHRHRSEADGHHYVEIHTVPVKNSDGRVRQVVHISRNITKRKQDELRIRHMAYYDSLTGLPNRTYYRKLLARSLDHARRHDRIMATMIIDLDSFKRINDTLGHAVGDSLLKSVAKRLRFALRSSDCVARFRSDLGNTISRLGGDEFIILLNEMTRVQDAAMVADRLLSELAAPFFLEGHEVVVTASIGIAVFPADGDDADTLFKNADLAMYHAKSLGKNKYQYYTESMNVSARERLTVENDLRRALARNELVLYYQPQVSMKTLEIRGLEALVRWQHPRRGLVPPLEFIPVAEQSELIHLVGEWVLHTACRQLRKIHAAGHRQVRMAVNLSNHQFTREDLVEKISSVLAATGLEGRFLELELTESAVMQNPQQAVCVLQQLRELGIHIAVDDFGTGYSSFEWLKILPLDSLKVDRNFISGITERREDVKILEAILAMAESLGLAVIAEGVETEDQLALLRTLYCSGGQGFLFSRPLPAAGIMDLLRTHGGSLLSATNGQ
ncbi:MAG TPA: GGDEF and EAL domain-containing protein [Desulfobulbus sp.]|nr:GGDEF and EAL domain-containing protein [Desulfobulbus sp.]